MDIVNKLLQLDKEFKSVIDTTSELKSEMKAAGKSFKSIEEMSKSFEKVESQIQIQLEKAQPEGKPLGDIVLDGMVSAIEKAKIIEKEMFLKVISIQNDANAFLESLEGKSIKVKAQMISDAFWKSVKSMKDRMKELVKKPYDLIVRSYDKTKRVLKR